MKNLILGALSEASLNDAKTVFSVLENLLFFSTTEEMI